MSLEYGKGLRDYKDNIGTYTVFGANGPVGKTNHRLADGPGVILGRKGAYRGVHFSEDPFYVIDTAYFIKPKKKMDMRWLYYAARYYNLGNLDDGSPIPSTTRSAVYAQELKVPQFSEQQAIAHILGTLDDKIELNGRINETLEGMARALFKSWFIDFDPSRAKAEGRDTGLPREIDDLFPDEFVDSELGEITKGWKLKKIGDIASIQKYSLDPQSKPQAIWEHYSIPAFDSGKKPVFEKGEEIKSSKFLVPPDSILLSKLNPQTRRIWRPIVQNREMAVCSTEFLPFVPQNAEWLSYVEELLKSAPITARILEQVTGSTGSRQRAKADWICNIPFIAPPEKLVDFFCLNIQILHKKVDFNMQEASCLSSLRDTLLPKLISGEIRVEEAEKFLEVRMA